MAIDVPQQIKDALAEFAREGAKHCVCMRMATFPGKELGLFDGEEDGDANDGWFVIQDDAEDWIGIYCYNVENSTLLQIKNALDACGEDAETRYEVKRKLIDPLINTGAWIVDATCDYKRLYVDVTGPDTLGKVSYMFSIKNDEVAILSDTPESDEMSQICHTEIQRLRAKQMYRQCNPEENTNIVNAVFNSMDLAQLNAFLRYSISQN